MTVPSPDSDFPLVLSEIHSGSAAATDAVRAVMAGVAVALAGLPVTAPVQPVLAGLDELRRAHDAAVVELQELLAHAGDPGLLRAVGATWANDVGATAARLAGSATLNGVRTDDHWTGTAADAYRNALVPQAAALTAIKTAGDELDATLNDLADGIRSFWNAVSGALIALGVALAAAAATAATVVGTPVGVTIAIAALVAVGAAVNSARDAFVDITNATSSRSAELERRLSNDVAFARGSWPRPVTPISDDGSITDGDDTDWHLR